MAVHGGQKIPPYWLFCGTTIADYEKTAISERPKSATDIHHGTPIADIQLH
jgi:hypothetical protein